MGVNSQDCCENYKAWYPQGYLTLSMCLLNWVTITIFLSSVGMPFAHYLLNLIVSAYGVPATMPHAFHALSSQPLPIQNVVQGPAAAASPRM